MIVRISGGRGFQGAKAYYLFDKGSQSTTARVGFIRNINLPWSREDSEHRNGERGFAIMAWTAMHESEIKAAAGTAPAKRKLQNPVFTYSLSWHVNDEPSDSHMREAALSSLKALGMENCQAIIVRHDDRPNCPHCHVIVNRVDPTTGRAAPLSHSKARLSRWAQRWERHHGLTIIESRVRNNHLRAEEQKKPAGQRRIIKAENLPREEYERFKAYRGKTASQVRDERAKQQAADRAQLTGVIERREINAKRAIVAAYGNSRDLLSRQIVELQTAMDRKGLFASIVRFKKRLTGQIAQDRRTLAGLQKSRADLDKRVNERLDLVKKQNERDRAALENRHKAELDRDARYIAWREKGTHSQSSDGFNSKSVRMTADIGARFLPTRQPRSTMTLDHGTARMDVTPPQRSPSPAKEPELPDRPKRYSRAEGRGASRTEGRTRSRPNRKPKDFDRERE
jgi:hypothetical protein